MSTESWKKEYDLMRNAMIERIKAEGLDAPNRYSVIASSAMSGNEDAKAEIESFFGIKVKTMRDLWAVLSAAGELMTESQLAQSATEAERALAAGHDSMHDADVYLANHLKSLRKAAGLTQDELARKSGVVLSALQKYENGSTRLLGARAENVLRIARALDVTVEELIG